MIVYWGCTTFGCERGFNGTEESMPRSCRYCPSCGGELHQITKHRKESDRSGVPVSDTIREPDDGLRDMPHVFGYCARCQVSENDRRSGYCVVSPHGLAHQGVDGGMTACGHDATGPEWWWPL